MVSLQSAGNEPDAKFDGRRDATVSAATATGSIEWSGGQPTDRAADDTATGWSD